MRWVHPGLGLCLLCLSLGARAGAASLPSQPTSPNAPGSAAYLYSLDHETIEIDGRKIDFFAPLELRRQARLAPVVVFGHGQAIPVDGYRETFVHLARKGIAVLFPQYDRGFFDRDWRRMAEDYVRLASTVIRLRSHIVDPNRMVFSGHSKGAYVALVAAGLPREQLTHSPSSMLLFQPAGYDPTLIRGIDPALPVTLTTSDQDRVVSEASVREIFDRLPSSHKQLIRVASYWGTEPELAADHFFPLSRAYVFGGRDGVSAHHYYATWMWLVGAAQDARYLYGPEALETGLSSLRHERIQ